MESYYSFSTLARSLIAIVLFFCVLIPEHSPKHPLLRRVFLVIALVGIGSWALVPVCPWAAIRQILNMIWLPNTIIAVSLYLFFIISRVRRRNWSLVNSYTSHIADFIREGIVFLDAKHRIISRGGQDLIQNMFPQGQNILSCTQLHPKLLSAIQNRQEFSGEYNLYNRNYYVRYDLLPSQRGGMLLLSDLSKEYELIQSLQEKEMELQRKRHILSIIDATANLDSSNTIKEHFRKHIETLIQEKTSFLLKGLEDNVPIDILIQETEYSIKAVRTLVNDLAPGEQAQ